MTLKYTTNDSKLHNIAEPLQSRLQEAQAQSFVEAYPTAVVFLSAVASDLRISVTFPSELQDKPAFAISEMSYGDMFRFFGSLLRDQQYPEQSISRTASALSTRAFLVRAFSKPDEVVSFVRDKIVAIIGTFPKTARDIEVGRNKGDVLDPFIFAATQYLLYEGDFQGAVSATVSHKALMIIEGLLGHLHEDVLGLMRGNVRVPEPRGADQEAFDYATNPFPGADLVQPPCQLGDKLRIHQIKSKTGSAKGGDGKRLGDQLKFLSEHYDADIFYDALVGNTLVGHRSKRGVEKAAPNVRVLVGQAAFRELTGSVHGGVLLLRLYQEAFIAAAEATGYAINEVTELIAEYFRKRAEDEGEAFLDSILATSTGGMVREQDSRLYNARKKKR